MLIGFLSTLILGSSNGLGKQIFDLCNANQESLYGISRYTNNSTYELHCKKAKITKVDLLAFKAQQEFDDLIAQIPCLSKLFITIGGGYGISETLPSYEQLHLLHKLNLLIPAAIINSLANSNKLATNSKTCLVSSIATDEVIGSTAYTSSKASLNSYAKCIAKKLGGKKGAIFYVKLGAMEGSGTSFDRLRKNNVKAYDSFVAERLPYGMPMPTEDVARMLISFMSCPNQLVDGMVLRLDANESSAI